jgi:hypothetical protein
VVVLAPLAESSGTKFTGASSIYSLDWWTVDGGGGVSTSAGGQYSLSGTVGQADAGAHTGGSYSLPAGFWGAAGLTEIKVYLPLVLRGI